MALSQDKPYFASTRRMTFLKGTNEAAKPAAATPVESIKAAEASAPIPVAKVDDV